MKEKQVLVKNIKTNIEYLVTESQANTIMRSAIGNGYTMVSPVAVPEEVKEHIKKTSSQKKDSKKDELPKEDSENRTSPGNENQ